MVISTRVTAFNVPFRPPHRQKHVEAEQIDAVLDADERRRSAMHKAEEARAAQNAASKEIGRAEPSERESKIAEASRLKTELEALEALEAHEATESHESIGFGAMQKCVHLIYQQKCCKMNICLQKSALIESRTSPLKLT